MPARRLISWLALLSIFAAAACRGEAQREFPLKGQLLSVAAQPRPDGRRELSVKHEDIPGFMPAMTMAYAVKEPKLLDGLEPGDLISARLIVAGGDLYLDRVTRTGHAPLPADARPVKAMDVMDPGAVVPDDELVDQEGRTRRLSDWRGRAVAVTFVYTRCPLPDFCPLMDRHFGELQRAIESDPALRDRAHLLSVSFDPAHDTPTVVAAHAKARGADPRLWSYMTGSAAAIEHVASRFGVSTMVDKDSPETITHNLRTAVVDAQGRLVKIYSGNDWTVAALLADLRDAAR